MRWAAFAVVYVATLCDIAIYAYQRRHEAEL